MDESINILYLEPIQLQCSTLSTKDLGRTVHFFKQILTPTHDRKDTHILTVPLHMVIYRKSVPGNYKKFTELGKSWH